MHSEPRQESPRPRYASGPPSGRHPALRTAMDGRSPTLRLSDSALDTRLGPRTRVHSVDFGPSTPLRPLPADPAMRRSPAQPPNPCRFHPRPLPAWRALNRRPTAAPTPHAVPIMSARSKEYSSKGPRSQRAPHCGNARDHAAVPDGLGFRRRTHSPGLCRSAVPTFPSSTTADAMTVTDLISSMNLG